MVALNPAYFAEKETPSIGGRVGDFYRSRAENRVGDFFSETSDRVGSNQPVTLIVTIEITVYRYETASGVHKYLYANANPASYLDPSGNMGISSIGAALYTHSLLLSMASASSAFLFSAAIQARVVSIAAPLSRELDLLAFELGFFDPEAASRISGLSSALKTKISAGMIARNIAVPTILAALPPPFNTTGFLWAGLQGYDLVAMLFAINAAAFSEINFSKNGVSVQAQADLHTSASFAKIVFSVRSPARDIGLADDALRSLREGRYSSAKSQFAEVVTNLSHYGSASAAISVTGANGAGNVNGSASGGSASVSGSGGFSL